MARKWSDEVKALQETLQEIDLVLNLVEGRQLTGSEAFEQINHLLLLAGAPNSNRQEHIRQKVQDRFAYSLEGYDFLARVDDALTDKLGTDEFSAEEIAWAKSNLDWVIVIL